MKQYNLLILIDSIVLLPINDWLRRVSLLIPRIVYKNLQRKPLSLAIVLGDSPWRLSLAVVFGDSPWRLSLEIVLGKCLLLLAFIL